VRALDAPSERTAALVNQFVAEAKRLLHDAAPANMVLLRGFDLLPKLPRFPTVFGLRAAAIAAYPMYRGLAKLVGMDVLSTGTTFKDEIATLHEQWPNYDFFFVHYKDTDKAGEDGDFDAKVAALERFDALLPEVEALRPDVVVVTGDHATPAILAAHGWQPVPVLVHGRYSGADGLDTFSERACRTGSLGTIPAFHLMPLVMANALRLTKYGA
jgi:2,3-bisphosphoglycerate-independent phosphoglycerate mutase